MRSAPRLTVATVLAVAAVGIAAGPATLVPAGPATLGPAGPATLVPAGPVGLARADECNDSFCTPGITPGVVLGAPCVNTATYVFGTTSWGRLVFCGSPRRYEPRYFRSPPMVGVKDLGGSCAGYENDVAQAPDGLFLSCGFVNLQPVWVRGDA